MSRAGTVLIMVGVALLGYVAWQLYGTSWVSHRHQQRVVEALKDGWASGDPVVGTDFGSASAIIEIPRFGSDYEVPVFEGTSNPVLAAGFGQFKGTAGPGEVGNYALAAHRVTHGEPLRDMPALRVGDEVRVVTRHTTYIYRLATAGDDLVVAQTDTWVTDPLPRNPDRGPQPEQHKGQRLITLTTCSELFHTDNRLIAFGVLERRVPTQPSR